MLQYHTILTVLQLILSLSTTTDSVPISQAPDALAILAFKTKSDLENKLVFELRERYDYCHWTGVKCAQGRVVRFVVEGLRLGGMFGHDTLSRLDQLKTLSLQNNSLIGPIPDLSKLINLKTLFLNHNSFSGSFPASIIFLSHLRTLDLSFNKLTGPIPIGLAGLDQLYYLRLEFNYLNGSVPSLNQSLLKIFNVSSNNLTGEIPVTIALTRFHISTFLLNPGLCGAVVNRTCEKVLPLRATALPQMHSIVKHNNPALVIGLSVTVALLVFLIVILALTKRKKTIMSALFVAFNDHQVTSPAEKNIQPGKSGCLVFCGGEFQVYTLEQLMRGSADMLGRGSIGTTYKTVLENNVIVTVKRIDIGGNCTITSKDVFERHMEFVGKLRHPNLVPLRAYFRAKEERLLIYDYYSNGSLSSLIHGSKLARSKPLHWTSCLKIAEDIAHGLGYIHQTSYLVHGNLKSSNVLLGPDFEACLTDYALSVPTQDDIHFTTSSDIYAFGILLLEVLTSKPSSEQPFLVHIDLLNWVRYARKEEDEFNGPNGDDKWLVMLVETIGACLNIIPNERPNATQLLKLIQAIKEAVTIESTSGSP